MPWKLAAGMLRGGELIRRRTGIGNFGDAMPRRCWLQCRPPSEPIPVERSSSAGARPELLSVPYLRAL